MKISQVYNYGKRSHEIEKHHIRWIVDGIYKNYLQGQGVDVGYAGENGTFMPVLETAQGLDLKTPGYNGFNLPQGNLDFVFASHMLEHVEAPITYIQEWFSKLKLGGHLFIVVPNKITYERKLKPPSKWNLGHHKFFTVGDLINTIEIALPAQEFHIRHLRDNRDNYDYSTPLSHHPQGCYDIEVAVQKIAKPNWDLK